MTGIPLILNATEFPVNTIDMLSVMEELVEVVAYQLVLF
jgi:hypothetical protein